MTDIISRLKAALKTSEFFIPGKTKDNGKTLYPLKCPECGKNEAWAHSKEPWSINCNRQSSCGLHTKSLELFPNVKIDIEREFKPTKTEPNRPAVQYLKMRGLSKSLEGLTVAYWPNVRKSGSGAAMFCVNPAKKVFNGRLINPPPGEGKTHNSGSTTGLFWQHPALAYDPDQETFVTEGIIEALSLIEMGFQAIAVLAAGQNPSKLDLSGFVRLTFAFDNDAAGHRALNNWIKHFADDPERKIKAILPAPGSDWNDFLNAHSKEAAKARFNENRPDFEFQARLAQSKTAQQYAETYFEFKEVPPGLFAFQGCYFFSAVKYSKNDTEVYSYRVSNFTIQTDHYQLNNAVPDQPEYRYHLKIKPRKGRSVSFTVSANDISSSSSLTTTFLTRAKCVWEGDKKPSIALARLISESGAPEVRQLQLMGLDHESGCYAFNDFMIDKPGQMIFSDKNGFYKTGYSRYLRPARYNTIKPEPSTAPKNYYRLILDAWGDPGAAAFAWGVASWFVSDIKARLGCFPFLSLFGDTQAGKSSLARVLNACQAVDEEGLPMRKLNTGKGEIRKLAQRSSLFIALLEGNNEENSRFDISNILTLYNNTCLQTRAKKTNDIQTDEIPFLASLAFVQNTEPFKTKAERERVLSVEFKQDSLNSDTTKAFKELMKIRITQLAGCFPFIMQHRKHIESTWYNQYQQCDSIIGEAISDARLQCNYGLILAFHELVKDIMESDYDIRPYMQQIAIRKHKQCNHRQADIAEYFFDIVYDLYAGNEDKAASIIDFRESDNQLWIYLKGVLSASEKRHDPIRVQLKDLQAALKEHPAYLDSNRTHGFRNNMVVDKRKAWLFDTTKMISEDDLNPAPLEPPGMN